MVEPLVLGRRLAACVLTAVIAACGSDEENTNVNADGRSLYSEPFRPQFHYSPPYGWMNDPNGMVFADGTYHLFYQFNPYAIEFGSIGWGQATSADLLRWRPAPIALQPSAERLIFSGSTVIDSANSSGLCDARTASGSPPCLVAVYTANRMPAGRPVNQTQDIAVSNDGGRTWQQFDGNPVIDLQNPEFRDPKVIWHQPSERWIMAITLPVERKVVFYGSDNLKQWERLSDFGPAGATGGVWECPDLFELPVDGRNESRWVLKVDLNPGHISGGSGAQYFIGNFNGTEFTAAEPVGDEVRWVERGRDFYCASHWFAEPAELSDKVWIGWMNNWSYAGDLPTYPWRGSMTLPRRVSLVRHGQQLRLAQQPVASIQSILGPGFQVGGSTLAAFNQSLGSARGTKQAMRLLLTVEPTVTSTIDLIADREGAGLAARIGFDHQSSTVFVERLNAGNVNFSANFAGRHQGVVSGRPGAISLDVYIDSNSIEVFADNGTLVISDLYFPDGGLGEVRMSTSNGAPPRRLEYWPIERVW